MTAALLGSVSNRVMHDAEVPVIVIHAPREDGPDLAACCWVCCGDLADSGGAG